MIDPFLIPTKRPTPAEYSVITVMFSVVFIILGLVGLVIAFRAPAEKHDLAMELVRYSLGSIGIGTAIGIGYWLFRRLKDSID